jgi:hypothetical protein
MRDVDRVRHTVNESSRLSKVGDNWGALRLLDDLLVVAIREKRGDWVRLLSRHAAAISDSMGNLGLVRHYLEQVLAVEPDDTTALYGLADILFRMGETDAAMQPAAKCYEVSVRRGTEKDHVMIQMIAKRWPEVCSKGWSG